MSCLRLRSTLGAWPSQKPAAAGKRMGTDVGQLLTKARTRDHSAILGSVCRRMKIYTCRCCLLHTFTMLWVRVCAAACEDPRLGTVPTVEGVVGVTFAGRVKCAGLEDSKRMFGLCSQAWFRATLPCGWKCSLLLPVRRDNGRYAVAATLCMVMAVLAACLEGDRQDKASCVLVCYASV